MAFVLHSAGGLAAAAGPRAPFLRRNRRKESRGRRPDSDPDRLRDVRSEPQPIHERVYFSRETFAPYAGGRIGILFFTSGNGSGTTGFLLGCAAGGEYYLDEHFSLSVEAQLNMTKSDDQSARFGNPGKWTANTAAAAFATIYF